MILLTGDFCHGKEEQVFRWAPEASRMDEEARPRTQGSLARQDPRRENLEAVKTDARRIAPESTRTRVAARTSSLVSIAGADHPRPPMLTKRVLDVWCWS